MDTTQLDTLCLCTTSLVEHHITCIKQLCETDVSVAEFVQLFTTPLLESSDDTASLSTDYKVGRQLSLFVNSITGTDLSVSSVDSLHFQVNWAYDLLQFINTVRSGFSMIKLTQQEDSFWPVIIAEPDPDGTSSLLDLIAAAKTNAEITDKVLLMENTFTV